MEMGRIWVGGPVDAKAGKSGEVWHFRRREDVSPDDITEVNAGSRAIVETPLWSTDFIPGAVGATEATGLLGLPGVGCCPVVGRNGAGKCRSGSRLESCCGNAPAPADAMESLSCCRVPVLRLPMVGGQEQPALLRSSGNLVELVQTSPWRPLLSPRKKGCIYGVCPQSLNGYS